MKGFSVAASSRSIPRLAALTLAVACSYMAPVMVPIVGIDTGAVAQAQEGQKSRVRRTPALRQQVFAQLERARDLADEGEHSEAHKVLGRLLDGSGLNSYERAMTWNLTAYVHYAQDDYQATAKAYQKVLEQENLPLSLEQNTLYSLAKLHLVQEQYRQALPILDRWFGLSESPGAEAWILKAQIHYQLQEYDQALGPVSKAIELGEQGDGKPAENWYLLARAIYYQQNDYKGLRDVLKALVRYYPKRQYWVQLAAVYGELGQEKAQVAAMEAAYEQGLLTKEQDLTMLARQLLGEGVPFKAAQVLDKGITDEIVEPTAENLRLLADSWMMAKEHDKAIDAMGRAAAKAEDGELYMRLAQIQLDQGDYQAALDAADKALDRGGLDRPDTALVVKGLAEFNLDRLTAARRTFRKAKDYEESSKVAEQWLSYIEREAERRRQLQEALDS